MSGEDLYCMCCGILGTAILLTGYVYSLRHRSPPTEIKPEAQPDIRTGRLPHNAIHVYDGVLDEEYYMVPDWK